MIRNMPPVLPYYEHGFHACTLFIWTRFWRSKARC